MFRNTLSPTVLVTTHFLHKETTWKVFISGKADYKMEIETEDLEEMHYRTFLVMKGGTVWQREILTYHELKSSVNSFRNLEVGWFLEQRWGSSFSNLSYWLFIACRLSDLERHSFQPGTVPEKRCYLWVISQGAESFRNEWTCSGKSTEYITACFVWFPMIPDGTTVCRSE